MKRTAGITGGVIAGGLSAGGGLFAFLSLLWLSRQWWYEAPDGDSLQYFDLMVYLGLAGIILVLPTAIMGGAFGGRWAARHTEPDSATNGGGM